MPALAGYNGRITLTNVTSNTTFTLRANSYSVNAMTDMLEISNFETDDLGAYLHGVRDFELSIDAHWFSEDDPFNVATFNLVAGAYVKNVFVFQDKTNGNNTWYFPYMIVQSIDAMQAVRDTVHFTAKLKNTTLPPTSAATNLLNQALYPLS